MGEGKLKCPDCERLNVIEERLAKVAYMVPHKAADGITELKHDAQWMIKQMRNWQKWGERVFNFADDIERISAMLPQEPRMELRAAYERLFSVVPPPKDPA